MDSAKYDAGDPTEWRPVVMLPYAHALKIPEGWELVPGVKMAERKILRVRPETPSAKILAFARASDCDATQFYEVHPEDAAPYLPPPPGPGVLNRWTVCSHQIVAD